MPNHNREKRTQSTAEVLLNLKVAKLLRRIKALTRSKHHYKEMAEAERSAREQVFWINDHLADQTILLAEALENIPYPYTRELMSDEMKEAMDEALDLRDGRLAVVKQEPAGD